MILLTVRYFKNESGGKKGADDDYKRAWVRLSNEETNQTIDYAMIDKIAIPDSYQPVIPGEED